MIEPKRERWVWLVVIIMILAIVGLFAMCQSPKVVIEEQGKRNAAETATVKSLVARFGADQVRIRALEKHRVDDRDLRHELFPEFADGTIGCVIVVTAGDDGVVFVEDPELRIIHEESLEAFIARTRKADPEAVAMFYLSLA